MEETKALLLKYLLESGELPIRGIGSFNTSHREAEFDGLQGIIQPPGLTINFSSRSSDDRSLVQWISTALHQPDTETSKSLDRISSLWNQDLQKKKIVDLPQIGRLFFDFENKINFAQSKTNSPLLKSEYPILNFKPILRDKPLALSASTAPKLSRYSKPQANLTNKSIGQKLFSPELMPITMGCIFFVLILAVYVIIPKQPNFAEQAVADKVRGEIVKVNQSPSHEMAATIASGTTSDTEHELKEAAKDLALEKEVSKVIEADSNSQQLSGLKTVPTIEKTVELDLITPPKRQRCVIITGAYRNKEGVKAKIRKIYNLGYDAYEDQKGDLYRVGVQFSYTDKADIQKVIKKVQEEISEGAWILEP